MKHLKELIKAIANGRVVPFVGSGVSMSVKVDGQPLFPSWEELLRGMTESMDGNDTQIVEGYCNKRKWFKAAEEALEALQPSGFYECMRDRIDITEPEESQNADWSVVDALWNLKPPIMVTTNYDNVLEWRKSNSRRLLNHQKEELGVLYRQKDVKKPKVWHLHGHIEEVNSLILAPSQYERFYGLKQAPDEQYKAAMEQFRSLLTNRTLLFVGFGLEDAYVMQVIGDVLDTYGGGTASHFALMKKDNQDAGEIFKKHNIQVIEYDDYGPPLARLLDELAARSVDVDSEHPGDEPPPKPPVPASYLQWLAKECSKNVDLSGMRPKHGASITLRNIYVPVTTSGSVQTMTANLEHSGITSPDQIEIDESQLLEHERDATKLLQELANESSLYISGAPGSGKTTFCRWLALAVCQGDQPAPSVAAPTEFRERFPEELRGRLPLLVRLRDFWETLPAAVGGDELTRAELEAVLQQWMARKKFEGLSWPLVEDHLKAGTCLLIFDGVDEVPLTTNEPAKPSRPRAMLLAGLADAVAHWQASGNRVLVTSRPYGLSDQQQGELNLPHAPVADLPKPLQELLVRRWFHYLKESENAAEQAFDDLWSDISDRPELTEQASNPLLLTALCIVYGDSQRLPQHEFDLYDRIVDTVLFNRYEQQSIEADAARRQLCVIAHGMHTGEGLGEDREQPVPEATVTEIEQMLKHYQAHRSGSQRQDINAHETREELLSQSGLLLPQGDHQRAAFYHFTCQDFLAANRLYDLHALDLASVFQHRGGNSEWRKTLGLLYGSLLHKRTAADTAIELLESLIQQLSTGNWLLGVVLADCLRILSGHREAVGGDQQQQFVDFCVAAIEQECPLKQRVDLALALGRLGDPRVSDDIADDDAWVTVEPGKYRIGDDNDYNALKPQTVAIKHAFQITKYPVTNAQFDRFVKAGGYQDAACWNPLGWQWREDNDVKEPRFWRDSQWNGPTQPVVGVSWWEADAFARWLGFTLPNDRQWETAARGEKGLVYPWSNDWRDGVCNSHHEGLRCTTPVGIFPSSESPSGAHDMAGNVWEWTSNTLDGQTDHDGSKGLVLRGGAWNDNQHDCRSAIRNHNLPENRLSNFGFRLSRT